MIVQQTKLEESPLKNRLAAGVIVLFVVVVITVFGYAVIETRRRLILVQTHNDLKWIGLALHRYHDEHRHFPPVVELDQSGSPRHSWRAIIQPHLAAHAVTSDNFNAYDFRQKWDSDINSDAVQRHRFGDHWFQFLAVVGPHAAWSEDGTRKLSDITDGTSNTILVIGIRDTGTGWNEPRDADFDGQRLTIGGRPLKSPQDIFVLFADGSVRYGVYSEAITPMLTIDAGDQVPDW